MGEIFISHDGEAPLAELEPLPSYDSLRGWQLRRTWVGSRARIMAKLNEVVLQGAQSVDPSYVGDGITLQLTATFAGSYNPTTGTIDPSETTIVTEWTSEPTTFSKSIWDLPAVVAEFNKLGTDDVGLTNARKIRNYIDALIRGESTVPDPSDTKGIKVLPLSVSIMLDLVAAVGMSRTVFQSFLRDLFRGVTSFTPAAWTLRRTRRVPGAVIFQESSTNVGRMLSYSALLAEGFSPGLLRTGIPSTGFWLKQHPADRPVGDGTREVITEYWWAEDFSKFIYGEPV